jgi:hypothetical protein
MLMQEKENLNGKIAYYEIVIKNLSKKMNSNRDAAIMLKQKLNAAEKESNIKGDEITRLKYKV